MITVHHLNESRSQRILWLLEELGLPYEIKFYKRDATTNLAPPELEAVHPLGKSPVITDVGRTIAESGAIVDYIVRRYGGGRLAPDPAGADYDKYQEWLHYSEGSAMLPLMLLLYTLRLGEGGAPLQERINGEIENHLGYVNRSLEGRDYLMGAFTAADVQMSFVGEVGRAFGRLADKPNINAWVDRMHARPAYKKALEKGGAYAIGQ
jgi:glutathione S-transferase